MITPSIRRIALPAVALLAALPFHVAAVPAAAQLGGQAGLQQPVNYLPDLRTIADGMSKQYKATIVVDPSIYVAARPVAPPASMTIEKAMDAMAASIRGLAWRRVYVTASQAGSVPAAGVLADAVRALDKVQQAGLVLENPGTRQATTYLKNWPVTGNFASDLTASQFSSAPIYVLYTTSPTEGGKSPRERLADLQRESMALMLNMSPQDMLDAANQGIQMLMNMDPQTRAQFMSVQMRAGMQMMQSMSPEQRNELIQSAMQAFGNGAGAPGKP